VHFDAHFRNILTDGRLLSFADFGLALSSGFALSEAEAEFLSNHLAYDRCYTASHLLRYHLPDGTRGETPHDAFLREWLAGRQSDRVPPEIAAIIDRNARAAVVLAEPGESDIEVRLVRRGGSWAIRAQAATGARNDSTSAV
jgi:hypothetical protein